MTFNECHVSDLRIGGLKITGFFLFIIIYPESFHFVIFYVYCHNKESKSMCVESRSSAFGHCWSGVSVYLVCCV